MQTAAERMFLVCAKEASASADDPVVVALMELAAKFAGTQDRYYAAFIGAVGAREFPGATPFGAMMALGERLSEPEKLAAFALGCEINVRLATVLAPQGNRGWDLGGVAGVFGSSVTGALLLGANAESLARAVGIASSMTLGQRVSGGTPSAKLIAGKASSNGVLAALLAQRGFTGPSSLEASRGLCTVLGAENLSSTLADVGERWTFA